MRLDQLVQRPLADAEHACSVWARAYVDGARPAGQECDISHHLTFAAPADLAVSVVDHELAVEHHVDVARHLSGADQARTGIELENLASP